MDAVHVNGAVIGGVAAAIHGSPRTTRDVDAVMLLDEDELGKFIKSGEDFGFFPRISQMASFAKRSRVLLFRHEPSQVAIDISIVTLPFEEEAVARAKRKKIGSVFVPLITPEDLIVMKMLAHRPRDFADVEAILESHAHLDFKRIRHWLGEISKALDMPEILEDFERILTRMKRRKG